MRIAKEEDQTEIDLGNTEEDEEGKGGKGKGKEEDTIEEDPSLHFRLLSSHLVGSFFFCLPLPFLFHFSD